MTPEIIMVLSLLAVSVLFLVTEWIPLGGDGPFDVGGLGRHRTSRLVGGAFRVQ